MDYRALGELLWFTLLGLSVFVAVTGLSIRLFIAPVVRDVMERLGTRRDEEQGRLASRVEFLESRFSELETDVHRLNAAEEFHRRLEGDRDEE